MNFYSNSSKTVKLFTGGSIFSYYYFCTFMSTVFLFQNLMIVLMTSICFTSTLGFPFNQPINSQEFTEDTLSTAAPHQTTIQSDITTASGVSDLHYVSPRTTFSSHPPTSPPSELQSSSTGSRHRRHDRHGSRSYHGIDQHVCQQVEGWVVLDTVQDTYGNNFTVVPQFDIGGVQVNQFFYETKCTSEHQSCHGIDASQYKSQCRNKYSYVYAYVYLRDGHQGWKQVKMKTSCNCVIQRRKHAFQELVNAIR